VTSRSSPRIDLLCYGLSDAEARSVEAVAIDLIGRPPLTNIMAGALAVYLGVVREVDRIRAWPRQARWPTRREMQGHTGGGVGGSSRATSPRT
jgi:hypothetical protein